MVSVLCTSSDDPLYLYSFMKISQRVFELLRGHKIMTNGQTDTPTDRQMDGQTNGQGDYYRAPPTSSGGVLIRSASLATPLPNSCVVEYQTTYSNHLSKFG